jgi:hypothetical protein
VKAGAVVVATNTPINDQVAIHTKQAPYLTYAIGARVPCGSVERALYWDTLDAYHYIRLQPMSRGGDVLIVGGEDHKSGQANDQAERWDRLEAWSRERFPMKKAVLGRLSSPRLHRPLERGREDLGLPQPRLVLRPPRTGHLRPGQLAAGRVLSPATRPSLLR